jgi:hypothetical protein
MEIFKTFNGASEADLKASGTRILVDWEQLTPAVEKAALLRPYETVKGWIIGEHGIEIVVGQKPGRKTRSTDE